MDDSLVDLSDSSSTSVEGKSFLFHPSQQVESKNTKNEAGRSLYLLGKIYYDKSDLDKAEKKFENAIKAAEGLALESSNYSTLLKAYGFLIRIASEKLDIERVNDLIVKSEDLVMSFAAHLGALTAEYFYYVGMINTYKGNFETARDHYLSAYKKAQEENAPDILAKCLLALATNGFNTKDHDGARQYLRQLDELLKIIGKSYLLGSMYVLEGKICLEEGLDKKAIEYFEKAALNLSHKKCWNLHGHILMWRGLAYKGLGQLDKAILYFKLALESTDTRLFRSLTKLLQLEIEDANNSNVDIFLDRTNRQVQEKTLGIIDFKHRFVLLEILFLLARSPGTPFDKEQLARSIWKDEYNPLIHDKLIYTSVSRLRKLIEPKNYAGTKRKYIIRGKDGYAFNPLARIKFGYEHRSQNFSSLANVELGLPV